MRGRAADVKDITERLLGILSGNTGSGVDVDEPVIMVAEESGTIRDSPDG